MDLLTGLRAAAFAIAPLIFGLAVGQLGAGALVSLGTLNEDVVSALGAINLSFTEPGGSSILRRVGPPALGCLVNAFAFSMGTLVGVSGSLAVPLVAAGVFLGLMIRLRRGLYLVGVVASTVFVVAVGLPGGSEAAAFSRFWLVLVGGLWALLGAVLQWLAQRRRSASATQTADPSPSGIVAHSLVVALIVAAGLAISDLAGLERDYWVMLTVISCVRLKPTLTLSVTLMRVVGTIGGAIVALAVTFALGTNWLELLPLFAFGVGMFSTRNSNYAVFTLFLTCFIILLLDLAYPGDQQLALIRVLDTCLGGVLSLVAGALLWSISSGPRRR